MTLRHYSSSAQSHLLPVCVNITRRQYVTGGQTAHKPCVSRPLTMKVESSAFVTVTVVALQYRDPPLKGTVILLTLKM